MSAFLEQIDCNSGDASFVSSGVSRSWRDVMDQAKRAAGWCLANGERQAVLLSNNHASASFIMGALRSGGDVCSLHLPHRGQDPLGYIKEIREVLENLEVERLLVSKDIESLFSGSDLGVFAIEDTLSHKPYGDVKEGGRLVQFTSGSTSAPNPVPLEVEKIAANVVAIMERIGPRDVSDTEVKWAASSWLPLSHDMGLCGMLLCSWYMGAPFVLRDPMEFMSDPLCWLRDISETRSMVTAAPNFALPLAMRALERRPERLDISSLRACILGGEMNRPADLLRFYAAMEPYGLKKTALCPAYGMAEAVLAVSIDSPECESKVALLSQEQFENPESIDPLSLEYRSLFDTRPLKHGETGVLGAGDLLAGYTAERDEAGVLRVDGPSVFEGYMSQNPREGAHETRDIGFVRDRHVHVLGRADEVIVVRGRNLAPSEVEAAAWGPARAGLAAGVPDGDGGLALVIETQTGSDPEVQVQAVRRQVTNSVGVGPSLVVVVASGSLPKTASGKIKRREVASRLATGRLEVEYEHRFGRR
jgi:acyl-CoA synthetase (AMP-forming)/AMP-acid ligase II